MHLTVAEATAEGAQWKSKWAVESTKTDSIKRESMAIISKCEEVRSGVCVLSRWSTAHDSWLPMQHGLGRALRGVLTAPRRKLLLGPGCSRF